MPLPYFYGETNIGLRRDDNEDTIACKPSDRLWLVADGMGGHASGEVASAIAADTITKEIHQGSSLEDAIQKAHQQILSAAESGVGNPGMGSTIVALRSSGSTYKVAWVGDSRAYLWANTEEGPQFSQLTTDHSYVQLLFESGAISAEEMNTHPEKNIITQCLGSMDINEVKVDAIEREWRKHDLVILCSDGLSDAVDDQTICNILARGKTVEEATHDLINAALARGGKDNISVVLISRPPTGFRRVLSALLPS